MPGNGKVGRVVLLGVGSGSETDWRKAGGALTAKLLTQASSASVHLNALATAPSLDAVTAFAGAAVQRAAL